MPKIRARQVGHPHPIKRAASAALADPEDPEDAWGLAEWDRRRKSPS